ncbi:MAG: hypothetical protein M1834_006177 [Cirrosporium novae-zelandiae]|nr:MAG: hypothetical protein M1834_006177 [Cirrosporium novae-zelandiae]
MLGKRKREATVPRKAAKDVSTSVNQKENETREKLRLYFESQFQPLEISKPAISYHDPAQEEADESENDSSSWDGISENEESTVEVISYEESGGDPDLQISKEEFRSFMSSKPPTSDSQKLSKAKIKNPKDEAQDEADDATNLKNDLSLQRLLRESHLLDQSSIFSPSGSNRHKAIDIRLQSLGAKNSILIQEKMPMSQRKGIIAKAAHKEDFRRQEARENGIILEKVVKRKKDNSHRDRGVGAPGVGRFKGGTLKLSRNDIAEIQGPKRTSKKGRR